MGDVLYVCMRWLHIASVVTLIGGLLFMRLVLVRTVKPAGAEGQLLLARAAAGFRPFVFGAIPALLVSGTFRLLTTPGHRAVYHMLFGIKMLLVLHVFAVAVLIVRPENPRRARMLTGTVISGLVIIFISAWLGRIF